MAVYDYGNARLKAMKSRLLSRRELESLEETGSLEGLISALTGTAYRKSVEAALARASGMDCIDEALRNDLVNTLGKARTFYDDGAGEIAAIALRTYDVHNLKAILRGLSRNAPPAEILSALLPVGELDEPALSELARAPGPRGAIDLLATMGFPLAQPLLKLRASRPGADTFEMELALDQWHYQEAQDHLKEAPPEATTLLAALELDADLANLLTVLRFAHTPAERKLLIERLGAPGLPLLFVGPGKLPFTLLANAGSQDSPEAAMEEFIGTPYEKTLNAGLADYSRSGRLSDFERHLQRFRLDRLAKLIQTDPLGIGVLLGYLALKTNEVGNIRWIARGIHLGLNPDEIRSGLEILS